MQSPPLLPALSAWIGRALGEWNEARRLRRELQELAAMGARELTDLGISHAAMAAMKQSGGHG